MLLNFKVKNYKLFKDEMNFSMEPAPRLKGLDYSILNKTKTIAKKKRRALSSAVVYGPNASGKTNIFGAMQVLKEIVVTGNIKNKDEFSGVNYAIGNLELIPNRYNEQTNPVEFEIEFITNSILYKYILHVNLGQFLDNQFKRNIIFEALYENEKIIFERNGTNLDSITINNNENIRKETGKITFHHTIDHAVMAAMEKNLNSHELFLTNGYKSVVNLNKATEIINWFKNQFIIIYRADKINLSSQSSPLNMGKKNTGKISITGELDVFMKELGINNSINWVHDDENDINALFSFCANKALPSDYFESHGTIRLAHTISLLTKALKNGSTLVIDEFDASMHPMILMSIINCFHNDEININESQLIFNTHNPIFLNSNLFRRDEIHFVERKENGESSEHYVLSDFGTSTKDGVRKNEDYLKNYFVDKYGAIKNIDFSNAFHNLINPEVKL